MPFVDLGAQYKQLKPEINARIQRVLEHGSYIMGPEVAELEQTLTEYVGVAHAVGCSSGTDALLMALMALGVGPGDAILTTPFTFIATAEVISVLGATPVFVDIDPATYNIDAAEIEKAVRALQGGNPEDYPLPLTPPSSRLTPKGVIAVDLYGLPADYDALQRVCEEHELFLIADAAQSFGGEYRGRRVGSLGDMAATSFFPAKPLGCYGDGGMVFTQRDDLAEALRSIRVHGQGADKYDNVRVGLNGRLDTLQAAILLAKFAAFPKEVQLRQKVAQRYTELLSPHASLLPPHVPEGHKSAWAQYTLRIAGRERDAVRQSLQRAGIPTAVYYPKPLHRQACFGDLGYPEGAFPAAEAAAREVVSLPFGPCLTDASLNRVAAALAEFFGA
jgi:dTDP-4-amino-4,6-dideoxygalactose transaminase